MALPNFSEIFTDFGHDGFRVSFREFLGYFVKQFWPGVNTQIDKLYFSRIDYPLFVMPFFLLAIAAIFRFWERPTPARGAAAGAATGILLYVYFNTWVYLAIVLGLLALWALVAERGALRGLLVLWAVLGLVAVPFFINYFAFTAVPGHTDFLYRQWLAEGREPGLAALGYTYLAYALLAAAVWRIWGRSDQHRAILLLAFLAAAALSWNVQLVTGYVPAPDHWKRIISPVLYIIVWLIGAELIRRLAGQCSKLPKVAVAALIVLTALAVTKKVTNAVSLSRGLQPWIVEKHQFPQELVDSWNWINRNLPGEPKIISASPMTSQYLAVYTSVRPYVPYGILTPLPMAEIEERYLKANRLFNVPDGVLRAALGDLEAIPSCTGPACFDQYLNFSKNRFNLYGCYFSRGSFNETLHRICAIPADYRQEFIQRYRRTVADWSRVDAEYVYSGPHERQLTSKDFSRDPELALVYENPLVEIYRIVKK